MVADLRVTPVSGHETFPNLVEEVLRIIAESDLQYQLHAMGTSLEGELDEILDVVRRTHEIVRKSSERVLIELSLDDRSSNKGELVRCIEHVRELGSHIPLERYSQPGEY